MSVLRLNSIIFHYCLTINSKVQEQLYKGKWHSPIQLKFLKHTLKCFPKMDAQFKHSENSISCKILSAVSNIIGKNLTKYPQVTNCHNYGLKWNFPPFHLNHPFPPGPLQASFPLFLLYVDRLFGPWLNLVECRVTGIIPFECCLWTNFTI